MKKYSNRIALAAIAMTLFLGAVPAFAVPVLQLYIPGSTYVGSSVGSAEDAETWVTTASTFTLGAYLKPGATVDGYTAGVDEPYFLSMAIMRIGGGLDLPGDLGFVTVNGERVYVTADMVYGVPPVEYLGGNQGFDSSDLSKHGIYPAWFNEQAFTFEDAAAKKLADLTPGAGFTGGAVADAGAGDAIMLQKLFTFDMASLAGGYGLHFDLYNEKVKLGLDVDVDDFAPFSHDAEGHKVPEPGTLVLFGSGLVGLAAYGRKRFSA